MLRISKRVEYALLAIKYIIGKEGQIAPVKEISEVLDIPFEFLAKTLQKLAKSEITVSFQGSGGGYKLAKNIEDISLYEIINAIEGRSVLVKCFSDNHNCEEKKCFCELKIGMGALQKKFELLLQETKLSELLLISN